MPEREDACAPRQRSGAQATLPSSFSAWLAQETLEIGLQNPADTPKNVFRITLSVVNRIHSSGAS
jgi:hypothetical protein